MSGFISPPSAALPYVFGFGQFDGSGTLTESYGIDSVTQFGVGVYTVVLDATIFAGINDKIVTASVWSTGGPFIEALYSIFKPSTFVILISAQDLGGGAQDTPTMFQVAASL